MKIIGKCEIIMNTQNVRLFVADRLEVKLLKIIFPDCIIKTIMLIINPSNQILDPKCQQPNNHENFVI